MSGVGESLRKFAIAVAGYSPIAPLARHFLGGIGFIIKFDSVGKFAESPRFSDRRSTIEPSFLDALIADTKAAGYDFISMDEVCTRLAAGGEPRKFAAITTDHAYRATFDAALPVLEKHEAPFTLYIAPSLINGNVDLWQIVIDEILSTRDMLHVPTEAGKVTLDCSDNARRGEAKRWLRRFLTTEIREEDRRQVVRDLATSVGVDPGSLSRELLMGWEEIRQLSAHPLGTIGCNTLNRYNLARLSDEIALREIMDCVAALEIEIGRSPRHMAYPDDFSGAVGNREIELAKQAGYASAVTSRRGVIISAHADHMHALPRIWLDGRYQRLAYWRAVLSGLTTPLANLGRS
ncbi:MAG: polysaccharide deacetylase family protein [Rhizobiaceae bacterium]|nr:polysaccharide deacetylase family protein [Rhizobiaceae bacterium]